MNTRTIIDLYFPAKVTYHLKIFLASALLALLFELVMRGNPFTRIYLVEFSLIFIQLEVFLLLAIRHFGSLPVTSVKDFTKSIIYKFIVFYFKIIFISPVIFSLVIAVCFLIEGNSLNNLVPHLVNRELKGFIISLSIGLLIGASIFFYFLWQDALKRGQKLREEKLIFQYETLKNQVNPHFLFNSLNTLSSLVLTNPSLAESFINKLSCIYRYILENNNVEFVELKTEIEFAKDYFRLLQIRDEEKIQLTIELKEDTKCKILPISLQILIENALKHNSATKENPLHITIKQEGDNFITVRNNLQRKMNLENSSLVGLINLSERVKLLTQREMTVKETQNEFIVTIPLVS